MKSLAVHYKNKYPGGKVEFTESTLNAYDSDGEHVISLAIGGNGQLMDRGAEVGALDRHDLSPIPKNTRVFKLNKQDKIVLDEEAGPRKGMADKLAVAGKILSIEEYKLQKVEFEMDGVTAKIPAPIKEVEQ